MSSRSTTLMLASALMLAALSGCGSGQLADSAGSAQPAAGQSAAATGPVAFARAEGEVTSSLQTARHQQRPRPTPTPTPKPKPSPTPTPKPSPTPTPKPSPTPTPQPSPSPRTEPSPSPAASPTPAPSPTALPTPSPQPSAGPIPQPVTTHPRLWITQADLPRLQSWAVAGNPIYQQGLVPLAQGAVSVYDTQFFPGGVVNPTWPDPGDTQGYQGPQTEQYAYLFAFQSLIDPSPANRTLFAQRARNLLMVAMNQAAQGVLAGAPFRDPLFPVYNRANAAGECWPLVVDWIYPTLSAQDKATIRTVFMIWANECLNASTTGGDHPEPVGVMNSNLLTPNNNAYRMSANNYYAGHARLLTLMALALDPADDPPVDATQSTGVLGNSMRSYIRDATGAWLYQQYTMFGEPSDIKAKLGLPANASVGLTCGGLPPEGMLYGHSTGFVLGELLALKTAGFADPNLSGPQVALANDAPVWDRFMQGMATSLVPNAQTFPGYQYMGPVFQMASYGDILRLWITPDFVTPMALLALLDQQNGDSSRLNAERWWAINAVEGGSANLLSRVQNPWSYGVQDAVYYFLLLDPTASAPTDPRANYPKAFYDANQGRLVEHSSPSMFSFRCSWISINHQQMDANKIEFYRNGEWLTKSVANYDNNDIGQSTDYQNTMSLVNWCLNGVPNNLQWYETPLWAIGSQWPLGDNGGDPTASCDVQTGYTYTEGDATNLYNRPSFWTPDNAALDILTATRSTLWLKPDRIVVYDRATSLHPNSKGENFDLTVAPTVNGRQASLTTPGGQHLYLSNLLPAGATVSASPIGNTTLSFIAELEPDTYRLLIGDPSNPTDTRFLNVLEGADASKSAPDPTSQVQSSSGTAFDGAVVGSSLVLFRHSVNPAFTGTSYTVPAGVTRQYVTGLTPGAGYTVTQTGSSVTVAPGGSSQADSGGVLAF